MAYIIPDYPELDALLKHLPLRKRRELRFIMKTLFTEFEDAQKTKNQADKKNGRIVKIVLFGSTARGTYVEDRGTGYFSDYDVLIVVDREQFTDFDYWEKAEEKLIQENIKDRLKAPIGLIVHSHQDVNEQISSGRPFFLDIWRDGIVLYEAKGCAFSKPGTLPKDIAHAEAQKYFEQWYPRSCFDLETAQYSFKQAKTKGRTALNHAAFAAHQATEHIYHCLLLTLKLYSPKLHHIGKLRDLAEDAAPELRAIWPRSKPYRRAFGRLRRAYVEARYAPHYEITAEELTWLLARIEELQSKVKASCEMHLRCG